ncbi:MAG: histidinol-phosphate transaminase [Clostridia bacterium]|nr:histidinol-phosphate transaminase [Clostridia bacterium]
MSEFFSKKHNKLVPYTPGEQPKDMKYIKLNTNESPYPPSEKAIEEARKQAELLRLYPDPQCSSLREDIAKYYGVEKENIVLSNGSDEILNFAFLAYGDTDHPFVFPDITYGFYNVFCTVNNIPYTRIPLGDDFTINFDDYCGINKNIVIANPNAPTGIFAPLSEIERVAASNPHNIVIIDEAYIDFGGETAIPLTKKYNNIIVVQTFSKSRSMAGARLGFAVASKELCSDLETIRYSINPYNINRMTMAAGSGAINDTAYFEKNRLEIIDTREKTAAALKELGFTMPPPKTNFIFAKSDKIGGEELYKKLREKGILVRHFTDERICEYNRITIGTPKEMEIFIETVKNILS